MTDNPIREGDVVLATWGHKARPGVVLHFRQDQDGTRWAAVVCGTGTYRPDYDPVEVLPGSIEGKAMRLEKPTYFYDSNVFLAKASSLKSLRGRCPPMLLVRLRGVGFSGFRKYGFRKT